MLRVPRPRKGVVYLLRQALLKTVPHFDSDRPSIRTKPYAWQSGTSGDVPVPAPIISLNRPDCKQRGRIKASKLEAMASQLDLMSGQFSPPFVVWRVFCYSGRSPKIQADPAARHPVSCRNADLLIYPRTVKSGMLTGYG